MRSALFYIATIFAVCILISSCNHPDKKSKAAPLPKIETPATAVKNNEANTPAKRAPIINISDTITPQQLILFVKDSALASGLISQKLVTIFGEVLPAFIIKNKLTATGAPIAWYKAQKAPFFFEAGLPVDKKPAVLPKGFFIKNIGGDSALVAHFFGPYDSTPIAYETLNDFLKAAQKKRSAPPYEVYVGNSVDKAGKKIDSYKVQTDIIFPYKKL